MSKRSKWADAAVSVKAPNHAPYTPPPPRSDLIWAGIDLDGTLAEPVWTPDNPTTGIGDPIIDNVYKLDALVDAGYKVVIHTSRPWTDYEAIEKWLNHWHIPWHQIQCGKPLFVIYVDDRGRHADAESWLPNPHTSDTPGLIPRAKTHP